MNANAALPIAPGEVLAGKYRVERILGVGGMGFVVAARNVKLGKPVALKMMLPEALAMPRAVERFEREARAAVQLRSEHVTQVLDIGHLENGAPYIVMELLEGDDFEGILRRDHALEIRAAVAYVLQACLGVAEAHAAGVVHRDLKPRNLFLSKRSDGSPLVKVLDFGISKWTSPDADSHALTKTTDVVGSPNYMSPEQVRSARHVDARTDIWSLGVILFELLTGRVPFLAESLPQLCALVLEEPAPNVASLRPEVPPGLASVVARCLEKDPNARYATVHDLMAALRPFTSEPTMLPGTSPAAASVFREGVGPLAITPLPATPLPGASHPDAPVVASGTSVSWGDTLREGRGPLRILYVLVPLAAIAVVLSFLMHRAPTPVVASVDAAQPPPPPTVDAAPTVVTLPSAVPIETSAPVVRASASAPLRPPTLLHAPSARPSASAKAAPPPPTPSQAPTGDPFTPSDRK